MEINNTEGAFVDPPMPSGGAGEAASGFSSREGVAGLGDQLMANSARLDETAAQLAAALEKTQEARDTLIAVAVGSNVLNGTPMEAIVEAETNFKDALDALAPVKERILGYLANIGYSPES